METVPRLPEHEIGHCFAAKVFFLVVLGAHSFRTGTTVVYEYQMGALLSWRLMHYFQRRK